MSKIKVIIGLGNEGSKYNKTYHNIGQVFTLAFKELNQESEILFYIPDGFMNQIGMPISQFLKNKNITPSEVLIIHDDSDQAIGDYKLVFDGGSGGHKGVQSVADHLGTQDFWRLKIGVRSNLERERKKAGDFVLKKWSKKEEEVFSSLVAPVWERVSSKLN